jgi:hypothetical protein
MDVVVPLVLCSVIGALTVFGAYRRGKDKGLDTAREAFNNLIVAQLLDVYGVEVTYEGEDGQTFTVRELPKQLDELVDKYVEELS